MAKDSSEPLAPSQQAANADHAWTLVRWLGIPIVLVIAVYFVQRSRDERPYVVVTNHGAMLSPEEIAAAPVTPVTATQAPAPSVPLVPLVPAPRTAMPAPPIERLQPISQPSPPYPPRALEAEREGVVRLRLTITPGGTVDSAVVLSAEPRGWFEHAAQDGVRRWRYEPSERGGTADVDVEFKLK